MHRSLPEPHLIIPMPNTDDSHDLRQEIAAAAALLIADGGLDYGSAKRKAARQVWGPGSMPKRAMPDNDAVDQALLEHLNLFDEDHQARVRRRREVALELMQLLEPYNLHLTGAVWKGIVTELAPIHLQAFHDNSKEITMTLLNKGIDFTPVMLPHLKGSGEVEAMTFYWRNEPVIIAAYDTREFRSAPRTAAPDRGARAALLARMA